MILRSIFLKVNVTVAMLLNQKLIAWCFLEFDCLIEVKLIQINDIGKGKLAF